VNPAPKHKAFDHFGLRASVIEPRDPVHGLTHRMGGVEAADLFEDAAAYQE
jgi:hypothetical protein